MVETYQFQIPKIQVTISEPCKKTMQGVAERASVIGDELVKFGENVNKFIVKLMQEVAERASAFAEECCKIAENVSKSLEPIYLIFRSIHWIRFEPSYEHPIKPVIEPSVLFRDSELDVCNEPSTSRSEVFVDPKHKVDYQRLIDTDIYWGIALWQMSRYETLGTRSNKKNRPDSRLAQWIHRTTRKGVDSLSPFLSQIASGLLTTIVYGLIIRLIYGF